MARTSVDSSESPFQLLKKGIEATSFRADDLPQILRPEGLSKDRVDYLKKEVQPFVRPVSKSFVFLTEINCKYRTVHWKKKLMYPINECS